MTMSVYEGLSLGASSVALLISSLALWSDIPLKRVQRKLAKIDLEQREQADIQVDLILANNGSGRFVVSNVGGGDALSLALDVDPRGGNSPLLESALKDKFPTNLSRGGSLEVPALMASCDAQELRVTMHWKDSAGTAITREQTVHAKWR